ncbi:MAG: hypothetical protein R3B93_08675 [Bacteroidia bacterium]
MQEESEKFLQEGRNNEVAYHVGRPGHEGYADRILKSWGVDGHNSHTNICYLLALVSVYNLWYGYDRPSPHHANAKFILLIMHLNPGHYFNPHAQRIIEGMTERGQTGRFRPSSF